jgi:hypothetical protein
MFPQTLVRLGLALFLRMAYGILLLVLQMEASSLSELEFSWYPPIRDQLGLQTMGLMVIASVLPVRQMEQKWQWQAVPLAQSFIPQIPGRRLPLTLIPFR